MNTTIETMISYGARLRDIGFSLGDAPKILLRDMLTCYSTKDGVNLTNLSEEDIEDVGNTASSYKAALIESGYRAMIIAQPEYVGMCIEEELSLPAVLEDMAMMVGTDVHITSPDRFSISKALKKSTAVMTTDGSVICVGRNLYEAYTCLLVLEKNAEIFIDADFLGGAKPINSVIGTLEHMFYQKKYSKAEITKQNSKERAATPTVVSEASASKYDDYERTLRQRVVDYGVKLIDSGLVQGTWGNISIRLNDEEMLCTPSGLDYTGLTIDDIVKVNMETLEYEGELKPTSEKDLHAGLYQKRPDVNAIVHTHSKFACVFAATDTAFHTTSGETIECARYAISGSKFLAAHVQEVIGENIGCLMSHHGMIAVGEDIEKAFSNAQSIENAAKNYIQKMWND